LTSRNNLDTTSTPVSHFSFLFSVFSCFLRAPQVQKQTLLFSATMTTAVDQLMQLSMKRPVKISVDANLNTTNKLRQEFVRITSSLEKSRESILLALCTRHFLKRTIVFFPLKWQAHRMKIVFGLCQLNAGELHGDMPQASRLAALQSFRDQEVDYLLCTDVAARGLGKCWAVFVCCAGGVFVCLCVCVFVCCVLCVVCTGCCQVLGVLGVLGVLTSLKHVYTVLFSNYFF
jgi:hypothetical protein